MDRPPAWVEPEHLWTLRELDLFADLTDAEVDAIGAAAPMRATTAGELLVSPDRPAQLLFIVKSGRVRLYHLGRDGRRLTTAIVRPGELFGEMVPLGQHVDGGYAEALEDGILCVMTGADVQRLLLSDARIAARIAEALGARVAQLERRLADVVLRPVPARIASALAAMAPGGRTVVRLTHEQLAELVGTTRETTTKVLTELKELGLIALRRGRIMVLDGPALRRLAESDFASTPLGGSAKRPPPAPSR
jgi:CRP/FNR family transcriptional regulator, cyclic AMP receptor protein